VIQRRVLALLLGLVGVGVSAVPAWAAPDDTCGDAIRDALELKAARRLAAARARLSACMVETCATAARRACAGRIAEIDAVLPALVLVVQDGQGHDLPHARVSMDGAPLVERIDGQSVAVDPGEHHLLFKAEGFNQIETTVVTREGQRKLRVLVFLTPASPGAVLARREPSLDLPAPELPPPSWSPGTAEPRAAIPPWRKKVGGALVGAAAAGVVVGTVWAFLAKAKYDHAIITECDGRADSCSPQGIADGRTAHDRALVSTIAFVGAGAFLAGAATVYFAWPSTQERIAVAPTASSSGAGVTLSW